MVRFCFKVLFRPSKQNIISDINDNTSKTTFEKSKNEFVSCAAHRKEITYIFHEISSRYLFHNSYDRFLLTTIDAIAFTIVIYKTNKNSD